MEIITEIEQIERSIAGRSVLFGFNGRMDTNIAVRTATIDGGLAVFHARSGITAMSKPEARRCSSRRSDSFMHFAS